MTGKMKVIELRLAIFSSRKDTPSRTKTMPLTTAMTACAPESSTPDSSAAGKKSSESRMA